MEAVSLWNQGARERARPRNYEREVLVFILINAILPDSSNEGLGSSQTYWLNPKVTLINLPYDRINRR